MGRRPAELRSAVSRSMLAQDARWLCDAFTSTEKNPASASAVALSLFGHSSRVVHDGARFLASNANHGDKVSIELDDPSDAAAVRRARLATKLLDDDAKTLTQLRREMANWLAVHRAEFRGNTHRLLRWLETDLSTFEFDGRLFLGSVPAQFRMGAPPGQPLEALSEFAYELAVKEGGILGEFARLDGGEPTQAGQDYSVLGAIDRRDRRAESYLARRYDNAIPEADKLLLLMVEGEVALCAYLLPATARGHREATFRARFVALFHCVRALTMCLASSPTASGLGTRQVREVLETPNAQWLLENGGAKWLRNQCMHYAVHRQTVLGDSAEPMSGLVVSLTGGRTFDEVDRDMNDLGRRLGDAMAGWNA